MVVAALVVGVLSIYATTLTFTSTNQTAHQETVTLNMQSGAQVPVVLAPGQTVPTQLNGNVVIGLWLYGGYAPSGVNAIIPSPNGPVQVMWQMAGGTATGCTTMPDGGTIS